MNIYDFWKAVLGQNEIEIRKYFQNDAYINWHCTNERFNVDEFIIANCEYPGDWEGSVERVETLNDLCKCISQRQKRFLSCHVFHKNQRG